jgi:hypothetical protein
MPKPMADPFRGLFELPLKLMVRVKPDSLD